MNKRLGTVVLTILIAMLLGSSIEANAASGRDNPDWNNTSVGVSTGRCTAMTNRSLVGTLKGDDGWGVNATIGFDIKDSQGRQIDMATGCLTTGYSAIVQLNHYVGYLGAKIGQMQHDTKGHNEGAVSPNWSLSHLPANADTVWVETYIREYTGSPCGMRCAGDGNRGKYGDTNRRAVKLGSGTTTMNLIAPSTPKFGGTDGNIRITFLNHLNKPFYAGHQCGQVSKICISMHAWSQNNPEGAKVQGWGSGSIISPAGIWQINSLAGNQPYKILVDFYDGSGNKYKQDVAYASVSNGKTTMLSMKA